MTRSATATRGFTLIELMTVFAVLAILIAMSMLKYIDLRRTALTAAAVGDIRAVHAATLNYYADRDTWPDESGPGDVPVGLSRLLPGPLAGSLAREQYTLDYENITIDGFPMVGVAITTDDPRLQAKLTNTFSDYPFFMNGDRLTYLISGPGGLF